MRVILQAEAEQAPTATDTQTILSTTTALSPLSRGSWSITGSSTFGGFPASNAIDGNLATFWHSGSGSYPNNIIVNMGSPQTFEAFEFTPRSDGTRTDPAQVAFYVSTDGTTWGTAIATDTWVSGASVKTLTFSSVTKQWFKFEGITGANNGFMACTEAKVGTIITIPLVAVINMINLGYYRNPITGIFVSEAFGLTGVPIWGSWNFCSGEVTVAYDHQWDLEGCGTPITYSVVSGALPDGLSLSTNHVLGTPTLAGTFTFTLRATNSFGSTDKVFSIIISTLPATGGRFSIAY